MKWKKIAPCLRSQLPVCCFYDDCVPLIKYRARTRSSEKKVLMCVFIENLFIFDRCTLFTLSFFTLTHTESRWMDALHKIWWTWCLPAFIFSLPISWVYFFVRFEMTRISYFIPMNSFRFWWRSFIAAFNACALRTRYRFGTVIWHFIFTRAQLGLC